MTTAREPPAVQWDPDGTEYKCCCRMCHVKTGTVVFGVVDALSIGQNIAKLLSRNDYSPSQFTPWINLFGGVIIFSRIVVLFCLFLGVRSERASLLIPSLVAKVIWMMIAAAFGVIGIYGGIYLHVLIHLQEPPFRRGVSSTYLPVVLVCIVIILVLSACLVMLWDFLVVLQCYRYFKAKAIFQSPSDLNSLAVFAMNSPSQLHEHQLPIHHHLSSDYTSYTREVYI